MSSKLESLKIKTCPQAFAELARKHNALVDLLAGMTGQNGVTVVMAERNAVIRGNASSANTNVAFANVGVVTGDGRLQNVLTNTNVTNTYPTVLKVVTASGNVTLDSVGLVLLKSSGVTCNIAFASLVRNFAVRTITVCNNNTAMSMDLLASEPY